MSELKEILVVLTIIAVIVWPIKEYQCSNYESMTNMETDYKVFDGCYVKTEKGWFLKEQLRDIQVK